VKHTIVEIAGILALTALPASAGVVLTQQENHAGTETTRTIMIEGNKQKSSDAKHTVIVDLDSGTMNTLDAEKKTATEMSMKGAAGSMMQSMISAMSGKFEPTGATKTIAGHSCKEYRSSGTTMGAEFTSISCISTEAPGAAEYTAFYRKMMEKVGAKVPEGLPPGVMLSNEMTLKSKGAPMAPEAMKNLPPDVAKKLAEAQAKQQGPRTFKTVVTSIKQQSLPPDTFAIPAGYTKQTFDLDAVMRGGGKPGAPKAPGAE
jgi:hypothetical protein